MKLSYNEREKARLTTISLADVTPEDAKYVLVNGVEAMAQYNFSDGHKLRMALERRVKGYVGPEIFDDFDLMDRAGNIASQALRIATVAEDWEAADSIDTLLEVMNECSRRVLLSANNLIW